MDAGTWAFGDKRVRKRYDLHGIGDKHRKPAARLTGHCYGNRYCAARFKCAGISSYFDHSINRKQRLFLICRSEQEHSAISKTAVICVFNYNIDIDPDHNIDTGNHNHLYISATAAIHILHQQRDVLCPGACKRRDWQMGRNTITTESPRERVCGIWGLDILRRRQQPEHGLRCKHTVGRLTERLACNNVVPTIFLQLLHIHKHLNT